jgi:hypothetical protein
MSPLKISTIRFDDASEFGKSSSFQWLLIAHSMILSRYVTGHLPRQHPHEADTTHDDRAEEGVFLGFFLSRKIVSSPSCSLGMFPIVLLSDTDIRTMHNADGSEDGDVPVAVVTREWSVSNRVGSSMIDDILGDEEQVASSRPMLQDYKKFKHGKEVPQEAEIQYLKQHLLSDCHKIFVHHKHVMHMTHDLLNPNPTNTVEFINDISSV